MYIITYYTWKKPAQQRITSYLQSGIEVWESGSINSLYTFLKYNKQF